MFEKIVVANVFMRQNGNEMKYWNAADYVV